LRLKIHKRLRIAASLNSEFTGSYEKSVLVLSNTRQHSIEGVRTPGLPLSLHPCYCKPNDSRNVIIENKCKDFFYNNDEKLQLIIK